MRAVVPAMRLGSGGSIINVASVAGVMGYLAPAYGASKWALKRANAESAALEFGPEGIRVNAILPGGVETPMAVGVPICRRVVDVTPLGRRAQPLKWPILPRFSCSDASAFVTGADLLIDGGFTAAAAMNGVLALADRGGESGSPPAAPPESTG